MADSIVAEKADRTPNWDRWLWEFLVLELWQLVALSLNINPDTVDVIEDPWTGTVRFGNVPVAFHVLLHQARERLGSNGVAPPRYCWMSLPNFAACARGWGWGMPPEMLEMADIPAWVHELGVRARADKQKRPTTAAGNANVEPRTHNKREDFLRLGPPALAESEWHNNAPPDDLLRRYAASIANKRWDKPKRERELVLAEAESAARERWKICNDDHAQMTRWLQNEYSPDEKTLPFLDEKLTKPLLQRMAKVAREIGKPVKGEKKSAG